jgi:Prokaryotic dksA/traR C4-type zinc finger
LKGRELERVETLLRQRSAGLMRGRAAMRQPVLDEVTVADPATLAADVAPPVLEEEVGGTCVTCGSAIPAARVRALPDVVRCVGCQLELEARRS